MNPRTAHAAASRGFTLIELLVTIALIGILLGIAAPSFITFQRNSELTTTVNSFLAAASAARAEAMKRGLNAYVVPRTAGNWATGWVAFVDGGATATADNVASRATTSNAADIRVTTADPIPARVSVQIVSDATAFNQAGVYYLRFNGQGYPTSFAGGFSGGAVQFTNGITTRRVVMNSSGRLRSCGSTDADCTPTPTGF